MFDIVENYLTLSGGSKETLRKIAEAFSGPSTKGVFESLIGRNPLFDDDSYRSNHDKTTYGTIDEICSLEIIDSGNDSGVLFIRFRTDGNGLNTVMTQPWSDWDPQLNDYTGYSIASGQKSFHIFFMISVS
jgi:hypothetical protein